MSTAAKAVAFKRLTRRALSLGVVKASDKAMQFFLPIILVRCLDTATFGEYRLLWLVVGTIMTLATLNMPNGLNFFLPRCDAAKKRLYVHQTILFLIASGLIFATLVGPWNPFLPASMAPLGEHGALVPMFVALWVISALLDCLPTVEERIRWQAYATVGTSLLRVVLVGAGAWASGEFVVILWLLIAVVAFKVALAGAYVWRYHGLGAPWFDWRAFADQVSHMAPLGLAGALYGLREQSGQWIAAALFSIQSFAAFSVGSVLYPLVVIFRRSMIEAFLPKMSRLHAAGDVPGMMEMNSRGNVLVGALIYPVLAFVFAFTSEIVTLVYTAAYIEVVPVMRVYIVAIAVLVIEVGSVLMLLRQGAFAIGVNALALAVSVATSWTFAGWFGLAGAAGGTVVAVCLDRTLMMRRISALVDIPVKKLQNWTGLALALGYAIVSMALIRAVVDVFVADGGPLLRVALGGAGLALVYFPILQRWRTQ